MPGTLLTTKHFVAPLRPGFVCRPRLLAKLDQGLAPGRRLILVSAPAGYGKTSLVAEWLAAHRADLAAAWIALDAGDNEPVRLLAYVVAALRNVLPAEHYQHCQAAIEAARIGTAVADSDLALSVLNGLNAIPGSAVIVLDDYQVIESPHAHQLVRRLLDGLPPQIRLAITTRADPPLGLPQLRVRDQLCELRLADLHFTPPEAADFLNGTMGLRLADDALAELQARTEGWIAGLHLAALSLQGHSDPELFIRDFGGSHRFVLEYLLEEVLERQPEAIQAFLLRTSILQRLSGELCEAVLGEARPPHTSGQALLELVESAQLFLVPLDDHKHWYRYHHLFAELLRRRLRHQYPGEVAELHRRASAWLEAHGLLAEAILQARSDPDPDHLAGLLESYALTFFFGSEIVQLRQWLEWLPGGIRRTRPLLAAVYSALLALSPPYPPQSLGAAEPWMRAAEAAATGAQAPLVRAFAAQIRSYWARFRGDPAPAVIALVEQALDALLVDSAELDFMRIRSALHTNLGFVYWEAGDAGQAEQSFDRSCGLGLACGDLFNAAASAARLAQMDVWHGRLATAAERCAVLLERFSVSASGLARPVPYSAGLGLLLGEIRLEWNQLDEAERLLKGSIELARWSVGLGVQANGLLALARLEAARGDLPAALRHLEQAEAVAPDSTQRAAAQRALFWLASEDGQPSDLALAQQWARGQSLLEFGDYRDADDLECSAALARVILAGEGGREQARPSALMPLLGWLDRQQQATQLGQWHHWTIELLVIECRARWALRDLDGALAALRRAVELAAPARYVRTFVGEGRVLFELLSRLRPQVGGLAGYVDALLAAFPANPRSPSHEQRTLAEPLTSREMEVLGLIAQGKTNPEIAAALVVSLNTVKKHTHHLFAKLSVANRAQAIVRAREWRLLG